MAFFLVGWREDYKGVVDDGLGWVGLGREGKGYKCFLAGI